MSGEKTDNENGIDHDIAAETLAMRALEKARRAENHSLQLFELLGKLARDVGDFRREVHESFGALGVKIKRTRRELDSLTDEIEDSKVRDLRKEVRKYKSWTKVAVGVVAGLVTTVGGALLLKWLHLGAP